jgi:RNA polymerase sigma-70 factor (ECF subfamily)
VTEPQPLSDVYRAEAPFLFGLCYRLTGCAADAEELVQETFARAVAQPPADPSLPWLVRVAVNLGRDLLRRRRRTPYEGPWLPSPLATGENGLPGEESTAAASAETRYGLLESVSFAFLMAAEALSPPQRATLILRDVLDYSVRETAEVLGLSEANVRITHHRARRCLAGYDARRPPSGGDAVARNQAALVAFVSALERQDLAAMEQLLSSSVRGIADSGGEFAASRKPVLGAAALARLFAGLAARLPRDVRHELHTLNGLPALVSEATSAPRHWALRWVLRCDVDEQGRIQEIHTVLHSRKLSHVPRLAAG